MNFPAKKQRRNITKMKRIYPYFDRQVQFIMSYVSEKFLGTSSRMALQ